MLTREQILGAEDRPLERVEVPEWGGHVYIRTISAGERDRFELAIAKGSQDIRARIAVYCMCDESGKSVFSEADIPALSKKSAKALSRVFDAAAKLNRILASDVRDLEKNYETDRQDGLSSVSPLPSG